MKKTLILFLISLFAAAGYSQESSVPKSESRDYKWLNKKIPLDTLVSYQGDTLVLFDAEKQYVISFWYTSCPPCIAEISWLNQLKHDFEKYNIEFIAISFDSKQNIDNLLSSHPFDFNLYYLSRDVINKNGLTFGYPTNLVVDKSGVVVFQKSGGYADQEDAQEIYHLLSAELNKFIR